MLAVKPQVVKKVLPELKECIEKKKKLLLSIAMGVSLKTLESVSIIYVCVLKEFVIFCFAPQKKVSQSMPFLTGVASECFKLRDLLIVAEWRFQALPTGTPIIRVMPNIPVVVGCGATVYVKNNYANDNHVEITKKLFSSVGMCEEVPESMINPITALAGSGPAYVSKFFFFFI